MKVYDEETLKAANGKEGRPALIACRGKVYDVSESPLWKDGLHMNRHAAGKDLTADIQAAPHEKDVLIRYPQVGIFKKENADAGSMPLFFRLLLGRFPSLRRHPHPMMVHFPIALIIMAVIFKLLSLIEGLYFFEPTSLHCLGAGILFAVPAIITGFLSWRINYQARSMKPIKMKIWLSAVLMVLSPAVFLWRLYEPAVTTATGAAGRAYFILFLVCLPLVALIGRYGGQLTFPEEKE